MPMIEVCCPLSSEKGHVCMRKGQQAGGGGGGGPVPGIDRGLCCCQTGGEGVLAHRQWAPASAERPILWIPVSCLLSVVSRGLLNRGHVLGRHLSCNYSTRIRFWWCVMITNNYCAFHASKGPRWGPSASIQRRGGGRSKQGAKGGRKMWRSRKTDEEKKGRASRLNHLEVLIS